MSRQHSLVLIVTIMLLTAGVNTPSWPYGIDTHRAINSGAASLSSLDQYLKEVLGLPDGITTPFGGREVRDWATEGGALEDRPVTRAANHFHYPLRPWDQALLSDFPGSLRAIQSSVLWAQDPDQRGPEDTWSWVRARREFFDGLTLSDAAEREVALGRTFRALGQVLHLVADGSVPAHARNDSHVTGEPLETWLERQAMPQGNETARQAGARFLAAYAPNSVGFSPMILGTTPNPLATIPIAKVFDADIYDGAAATLGLTTGDTVGITEFSNANLFSADTIFADTFIGLERFSPFPSHTAVEQFIDPVNNRRYWRKTGPGVPVEHLATVSRLDFFRPGRPPLTGGLDTVVHEEYARLLIPRAVGYSTGLIDYFFRGRLAATDPEFTETSVTLKVTNAIDPEQSPAWANEKLFSHDNQLKPGRFVLTVTYKQGNTEKFVASDAATLEEAEALAPGQTSTQIFSFDLPTLPDDATDVEYRLVFRGRLGQEDDAIAVGIVEPVSGFVVSPNYVATADPRISGPRVVERRGGKWQLMDDRNPQTGNVDWKGWYVNGRATKVLTWWGPTARYFPDPDSSVLPFRHEIYQEGEAFVLAPYRVLGAAIAKDSSGREWLVTICWNGSADIVFRRPNKRNTSAALYDPVTNPDGWRELGRFPSKVEGFAEANVPWFFNGDGIEAQTVRLHVSTGQRHRLKMSLVDTVATVTDENNLSGIVRSSVQRRTCQQEYSEDSSCDEAGDRCLGLQTIQALNGTNYSSVQGAAGEFVIAVDYRDKEEVLGIYTVTEEHEHTVVRLSTNESRSICSRFGACSSPENYSFSESKSHAEMKTMRKTVLRVPGFTDIVLASEHGTRQLDLVDSSEFVGQKLVNAVSEKTGSGDVKKEFRQIQYMDLRTGVYVGYEKLAEEAGPGRVFFNTLGGNTSVAIDTTEQSRQSITFREREIPVNTNPASVRPRSTVMISNPDIENIPCEQTRESTSEPSSSLMYTPPILKTSGAWAVDTAEHLFVSMPVLGDNPTIWTGQLFNYLTEGDLQAVIPGAPAKPGYYPGGVIK